MKNLYLVGGGGHCRSCIDVIELEGKYKIQGIFDLQENVGKTVLGYPIFASDSEIERYIQPDAYFLITLGQIKCSEIRSRLFQKLKKNNANLATVVSPRAHISKYARIEEGTIVMHDALINSCVRIGNNCIINSKALIEHDAEVGDNCHISTAAIINGSCKIMSGCFVGSNATLVQCAILPENTIVPAGQFFKGK